jgi:hypothetical protein
VTNNIRVIHIMLIEMPMSIIESGGAALTVSSVTALASVALLAVDLVLDLHD